MTVYVDSSALLKLYVDEPESGEAARILADDSRWVTGVHTLVEVRRTLLRLLKGSALRAGREAFSRHWQQAEVVLLDLATCELAVDIAEATGVRALDALHLGAAQKAGDGSLPFVTFDVRQARAARELGWTVLGA